MKSNHVAFAILLVAVLFMAGFAYYRITGSFPFDILSDNKKAVSEGIEMAELVSSFTYQSSEHTSFISYKNWIMRADREFIRAYTIDGNEAWSMKIGAVGSMLLKKSDKYLLAADIGGRHIRIFEGSVLKYDIEVENTIINAELSDTGWITVIHASDKARTAVSVYNSSGDHIFTRYVVERFITWAAVLDGAEGVALSCFNTEGITTDNDIEFLDNKGEPIAEVPQRFKDTAFSFLSVFCGNNVLISDVNQTICINKDEGKSWALSILDNKEIGDNATVSNEISSSVTVSSFADNGMSEGSNSAGNSPDSAKSYKNTLRGIIESVDVCRKSVAILGDNGQNYLIAIVDEKGRIKEEFPLSIKPSRILLTEGRIVAYEGRNIIFMDTKGNVLGKYNTSTDIKDIIEIKSVRFAIITGNSVEVVEI